MRAMAAWGSFHGPRRARVEILGESRTEDGRAALPRERDRAPLQPDRESGCSLGFDAMLGSIDEDWRDHLRRTP